MRSDTFKAIAPALMILGALTAASCHNTDPVAIKDSNIILTASPNPVDLLVDPTGTTLVQARVITSSGTPEQGVVVFFSATSGTPNPPSDTTDSQGVAQTTFSFSQETTVTVTARSGSVAPVTLSVLVTKGTPSIHQLTSPDAVVDTVCTDPVTLNGSLQGASGPISGAAVTFSFFNASPSALRGSFNPTTTITSSAGTYSVVFTLNPSDCQSSCIGPPTCSISVKATAAGLDSNSVPITDNL